MLRQRKVNYEIAILDAHDNLAMHKMQPNATDKEFQSLRIKRETYHAAAEELIQLQKLKARYESVIHAISNVRKQRSYLESTVTDLAMVREQNAGLESVPAELGDACQQMELSGAERDLLKLLQRCVAKVESMDASVCYESKENG
ncbi:hypothetical protein R1flu_011975 [Riccia fluitans]|uniref:Tubulin-specific chaperone A n=1 Tax=Riccia fluitans TaxID=41844 RepID=A0ABD1ZAF4_9MARC